MQPSCAQTADGAGARVPQPRRVTEPGFLTPTRFLAETIRTRLRGAVVGEWDRAAAASQSLPSSSEDATPRLTPCGFSTTISYLAE